MHQRVVALRTQTEQGVVHGRPVVPGRCGEHAALGESGHRGAEAVLRERQVGRGQVQVCPDAGGSSKYVWYAPMPIGPLPLSISWLPAAGIHGRKRAERVLLVKKLFQVRTRSTSRLA